jgi:hypothetical protein
MGWQTIVTVEAHFGTIEPHEILLVVPQGQEVSFGEAPLLMRQKALHNVKQVFEDATVKAQ